MIHTLIVIVLQVIVGLITENWLIGGVAGAAVYIGREHAQAEYRWIETYGFGRRANMPWWGGFDLKVWNWKSVVDWFLPLIGLSLVAVLV